MRRDQDCEAWRLLQELLLQQLVRLPEIASELRLSPAQCHLLRLLDPGRPSPMGRLAAHLSCDASNVTGMVDRLEVRGLVQRSADARDRRVRVICLTSRGAVLRRRLLARLGQAPLGFSRLTPEEQERLVSLVRKALEVPSHPAYP
jgi:DNA-binding MarR family transcriptional regulator